MSHYTRLVVPGGTYFFTVCLQDRRSDLLTERIDLLRAATRIALRQWPFRIDTAVILPDHLHMIWTLPAGDADFSARWRLIKSTFSRHIEAPASISRSQRERGEKGIWQRRFWEHRIRDGADLAAHRDFALTAPVRAGLVERAEDWPYSSIRREMKIGRTVPGNPGGGLIHRGEGGLKPTLHPVPDTVKAGPRRQVGWVLTHPPVRPGQGRGPARDPQV